MGGLKTSPAMTCNHLQASLDLNAQGEPRNWGENGHWDYQDPIWHKDKLATVAIEQLFFQFGGLQMHKV